MLCRLRRSHAVRGPQNSAIIIRHFFKSPLTFASETSLSYVQCQRPGTLILEQISPDHAAERLKIEYLGLEFDTGHIEDVVTQLIAHGNLPCFTVVTPNVDHLVRLFRSKGSEGVRIWSAYRDASLMLCDSRIIARLAKLSGKTLTVVPGSDLTAQLFRAVKSGTIVAVVGGDEDTLTELRKLRPDIILSQHVPPMGLLRNESALDAAVEFVHVLQADLVFLAVGSPQQELLAQRIKASGGTGIVLCIGAGIEFLTGRITRAPSWMQRASLEWLHRLLSNPRRLWRRYLVDGPYIFQLAWRDRQGTLKM